jgi:hypothetical protein
LDGSARLARSGAARLVFVAILLVVAMSQAACAPFATTRISGHVYGDRLMISQSDLALSAAVPLRAVVKCNGASATAGADGAYSLSVSQSDSYDCAITAPSYVELDATIPSSAGMSIRMDAGPTPGGLSCPDPSGATLTCPALHLHAGSIAGTVASANTQRSLGGTTVSCWKSAPTGQFLPRIPTVLSTTSDASGAYTIANVPPGVYSCSVADDPEQHPTTVAPGAKTTLPLGVCTFRCPPVRYHGSSVMHSVTAYLIFWLPNGVSFEPGGNNSRFESIMAQYINDIGGTPYYGIAGQYWDHQGFVTNQVTLGATYIDTQPYPHAGTKSNPLGSEDITHELMRVRHANNWLADGEHLYFIFTGYDIESCGVYSYGRGCSFGANQHYCAYHDYVMDPADENMIVFGYEPTLSDCVQLPQLKTYGSPNHDVVADGALIAMSHEHFEAVSDPYIGSWFDSAVDGGEIGDKCEYLFGAIRSDGSNVTLGHGHTYLLQSEWSNRADGCAFS